MGIFQKWFQKNHTSAPGGSAAASETDQKLRAMILGGSGTDCLNASSGENAFGCNGCSGCGGDCDPASCGQNPASAAQSGETAQPLGLSSIIHTFEKFYPGQTSPLRLTPEILWEEGGREPLSEVRVYDGRTYFHLVTCGLSELYEKESDNAAYSGYGLEFTVKLKKEGLGTTPEEINGQLRHMADILQSLARQVFSEDRVFTPEEYIELGDGEGLDRNKSSNIVGFITRLDDAGVVETPNGWVKFTELIGVTKAEIQGIKNGWISVDQMYQALGSDWTDFCRGSMM